MFDSIHDLALFVGYFIGSIPSAFIVARFYGVKDIRKEGGGNVGATNAARVCGPTAGLIVFLLDASKPLVSLLVLYFLRGDMVFEQGSLDFCIASLGVIIGQCFSIWLAFKGGKGLACFVGFFAVFDPIALILGIGSAALLLVIFKRRSIAHMLACIFGLLFHFFVTVDSQLGKPEVISIIMLILVLLRHTENISACLSGREQKVNLFSRKKSV